jgi:D-serine deaminase-like pyridoxal phosphate-dependent protein
MKQPPIGTPIQELDTPALLIDLDILAANIEAMAAFFRIGPAHLRPHVKSHKIPQIARLQVAAGAPGVCAAKVGEAEAMVAGGIEDVLVANQVVGRVKMERLVGLAERARTSVAVDDPDNVAALSRAAKERGVTIGVLVEVDVGMSRCGVNGPEAALRLVRQVLDRPGLEFRGLMGYEGHAMGIKDAVEREEACRKAMQQVTEAAAYVGSHGIPVNEVSGGGTMTYDIAGRFPGMTEIQAGSYALMDTNFRNMGSPFRCAMTLLAMVMSTPREGVVIADAGMKSLSTDFGLPEVKDRPGIQLRKLSEEHARLELAQGVKLRPGDKLELLPSHGCTTVNLHDVAYAVRGGRVEDIWPITGRGKSQ